MFVEYPKSLYMNADVDGEHVIVFSSEAEAEKRAVGFQVLGEPQKESEPVKRTRKAKQ